MELLIIRIVSVIAIAFAYMIFDLFNKRNVPSVFAYATIAYGIILTIFYFSYSTITISFAIAAAVFGIGYLVYKIGYIGFGDIAELTCITLILPIQSFPLLANAIQFNLPFILSVMIASGIAALVIVPLVYIPKARRVIKGQLSKSITIKEELKAVLIGIAYIAFIGVLSISGLITIYGVIILALLTFGSVFTLLFEKPITKSMILYLTADKLEEEDMIAVNVIDNKLKQKLKKKIKSFGQLVTRKMLNEIKKKHIRDKIPVYRNGIPFALPIFIGTVVSILLGNPLILAIH